MMAFLNIVDTSVNTNVDKVKKNDHLIIGIFARSRSAELARKLLDFSMIVLMTIFVNIVDCIVDNMLECSPQSGAGVPHV
jgi:hypothetical protein